MRKKDLDVLLDFSVSIVKQSSSITLKYFGKKISPSYKSNNTPVTIADYKCEEYLLKQIKKKYPHHSIFSEESGHEEKDSDFRWFIDPIDGTRNFMRNYSFWGTLLALEYKGEIIIGIISLPALNEFIAGAKGKGCFVNGSKSKVSKINTLDESYCLFGGLDYLLKEKYKTKFFKLNKKCAYNRGFGDCHGHSFIINGKAEIMIDPKTAPYDIAATKICIEEAGGKLTDINGKGTIYGGNALITNGKLHDKVLRLING
jgi:histidinol phosphatase-like enzyme (inositol monophosphatase family)